MNTGTNLVSTLILDCEMQMLHMLFGGGEQDPAEATNKLLFEGEEDVVGAVDSDSGIGSASDLSDDDPPAVRSKKREYNSF